jgi:arabinose-5-phosphate isomerase
LSKQVAPRPAAQSARRVIELEAAALDLLALALDRRFDDLAEAIEAIPGRVILTGMGKSAHVARKIAATLASTGTPAQFVHAAEAGHGDLGMITPADLVIIFSKSGATDELGAIARYCRRFDVPLALVTAEKDTDLAAAAQYLIALPPVAEACAVTFAPTTSTAMMMALGDGLAVALLERRGFKSTDFKVLHPGGRLGAALLSVADCMHEGSAMPLIGPDATIGQAIVEMSAKAFGCTGVVAQDGELIGVVTDGDLRRHMHDGLMSRPVIEIMSEKPITISPAALLSEALVVMTGRKVRIMALFAVDGQKPVGVVHIHDCLRAGLM